MGLDPHVVYPGNSQGRSFREQNERGCYCVTVDPAGNVEMEFHPTDVIRWLDAELSVEGVETLDQVDQAVCDKIRELISMAQSRPVICRLTLTGRTPLYRVMQKDGFQSDLLVRTRENFAPESPFVWVQEMRIECMPVVEPHADEGTLLGQVLRIADEIGESQERIEEMFSAALKPLFDKPQIRRAIGEPGAEEIRSWIKSAKHLCINCLEGDE